MFLSVMQKPSILLFLQLLETKHQPTKSFFYHTIYLSLILQKYWYFYVQKSSSMPRNHRGCKLYFLGVGYLNYTNITKNIFQNYCKNVKIAIQSGVTCQELSPPCFPNLKQCGFAQFGFANPHYYGFAKPRGANSTFSPTFWFLVQILPCQPPWSLEKCLPPLHYQFIIITYQQRQVMQI